MGEWVERMIAAGGALLNKYAAEQMPSVPAMRYVGKPTGGYSVLVRGTDAYVGYVSKLGNVWYGWHLGNIVTDERGEDKAFPTRKAAAEALWPVSVVERAARAHWRNATSDDRSVASSDSPEYRASLAAFLLAIRAAYPDVDVQEEYNGFIDHAETVIQGVNITRQQRLASARQAELDRLEEAAWETEANAMEDARDGRVQEAFEAAHTVPVELAEARRGAAFLLTQDNDKVTITYGIFAPSVPVDKATGVTETGIPFVVSLFTYDRLDVARRFLTSIKAELEGAGFKVSIVDEGPHVEPYTGTVYTGCLVA